MQNAFHNIAIMIYYKYVIKWRTSNCFRVDLVQFCHRQKSAREQSKTISTRFFFKKKMLIKIAPSLLYVYHNF